MELTKRLKMNVDLVPKGARVGDIGCDHGYVSIYLVQEKSCPYVAAMDVNQGPLAMAKKNIRRAGLTDRIELILSDGMEKLREEKVDTLLLAGMGGMLMCRILQQYPEKMKHIQCMILQPQSDLAQVRKLVHRLGFYLDQESACTDAGKFYIAMRAVRGKEIVPYTETEYAYGRLLSRQGNQEYKEYLLCEMKKLENIKNRLQAQQTGQGKARIQELTHILEQMSETLSY